MATTTFSTLSTELILAILSHLDTTATFSLVNRRFRELCTPIIFKTIKCSPQHYKADNVGAIQRLSHLAKTLIVEPWKGIYIEELKLSFNLLRKDDPDFQNNVLVRSSADFASDQNTFLRAAENLGLARDHFILRKMTQWRWQHSECQLTAKETLEYLALWVLLILHFTKKLRNLYLSPSTIEQCMIELAIHCDGGTQQIPGLWAIREHYAGSSLNEGHRTVQIQPVIPWFFLPALDLVHAESCTDITDENTRNSVDQYHRRIAFPEGLSQDAIYKSSPVTKLLFERCTLCSENFGDILRLPRGLKAFVHHGDGPLGGRGTLHKTNLKTALLHQKESLETLVLMGSPEDWGDYGELMRMNDGTEWENEEDNEEHYDCIGSLKEFTALETLCVPTWILQGFQPEDAPTRLHLLDILPPGLKELYTGSVCDNSGFTDIVKLPMEILETQLCAVVERKDMFPKLEKLAVWGHYHSFRRLDEICAYRGVQLVTRRYQPSCRFYADWIKPIWDEWSAYS
ncbi:hypothetical protein BDD12DRAFT_803488 [Trichophaea hybrida]|nr:hypothetical protein BDD12DRAFT_803488 [Trichophaea hybrida]